MEAEIIFLILGIAFGVAILLLLREVFCWYFKINERILLQQKTNKLLEEFIKVLKNE